MKKRLFVVLAVVLVIAGGILWYIWPDLDGYPDVRPYGTVPEEFRDMVRDDFLNGVALNGDVLVRNELTDSGRTVTKYDYYGNVLSEFSFPFETVEAEYDFQSGGNVTLLDNGYMVLLDDNNVVGRTENGNDLSFLMHDPDGNLLWEYSITGEDRYRIWLHQITPVSDGYYLWLVESGIDSTYEVIRLDSNGNELFVKELDLFALAPAGSEFNSVGLIVFSDGVFTCYLVDYDGMDLFVTLDMDLNVLSMEERERPVTEIGTIDGEPVRFGLAYDHWAGDAFMVDYPYGTPEMVLDYGGFYLVYSWQHTGINHDYQGSPILGSRPMRTQHIYAAFDKSGELLWIGTVDATRNS